MSGVLHNSTLDRTAGSRSLAAPGQRERAGAEDCHVAQVIKVLDVSPREKLELQLKTPLADPFAHPRE